MLVAVIGGNLQGVEAAYLAHKAGWEVRVVDKNPQAPAMGLCDSFVQIDVTAENELFRVLEDVDFVIPALEDDDALKSLRRWRRTTGIPFIFDPKAYAISSSKMKSAGLFAELDLAVPVPWPQCGLPVLAKPSSGSGSKGVKVFYDDNSLRNYLSPAFPPEEWVLQEYLEGSQHSLEVIGVPGYYRTMQVTDLYVDKNYDCHRVVSPTELSTELVADFEKLSLTIAEAIQLQGIMDVEVILHQGNFKVLEIDARLPSQTPTTVFWSTGENMVKVLGQLFTDGFIQPQADEKTVTGTVYEHIHVCSKLLESKGENIMTEGGPLYLRQNFFGADEAITNFNSKQNQWVATLIISETDRCAALAKRDRIIEKIVERFSLKEVNDSIKGT